jgi:ATP-dependent Clp protease adapter protein ClpS
VVILNDEINTTHGVAYALHRVAGLSADDAVRRMWLVHERGDAEAARFADRHEAESVTAWLQVYGLHAVVRHG